MRVAATPGKPRNYLRVRGEYAKPIPTCGPPRELPPRTRRILHQVPTSLVLFGTTSAYAENTVQRLRRLGPRGNYLRVRGEYLSTGGETHPAVELPPRTRRIPSKMIQAIGWQGTTSAYAENTSSRLGRSGRGRNYLRVRGEYRPKFEAHQNCQELPPRTRRILTIAVSTVIIVGTTSAYAENTKKLNGRNVS